MNPTVYKALTKAGTYKGYIIAAVLLIVCLLVYFNWSNIKQAVGLAPAIPLPPDTAPKPSTTSSSYTNDTVLKKGMRGAKVKELQLRMNATLKAAKATGDQAALPLEPLVEDGIFGNHTAMRLFALTGQTQISINAYKQLDA